MKRVQRTKGQSLRRKAVSFSLAALSMAPLGCQRQQPPEWVPLSPKLKVELARTPEERHRGLKFRQRLPADRGMYFIFEEEQPLSFYMRDTRIPLSIAFIRTDGIIVSIADMIPLDERPVYSSAPAQFALEANRRWFHDNGIGPGDRVVLKEGRIFFFRKIGPAIGEE